MSTIAKTDNRTPSQSAGGPKLESSISKDLLVEAVSSISIYAHHARGFAMTDRIIDDFVIEMLSMVGEDSVLSATDTIPLLVEAEKVFNRSKKLYNWSCDVFCRPTENLRETMLRTGPVDTLGLFEKGALLSSQERAFEQKNQEVNYWEHVCISKLSNLAITCLKRMPSESNCSDIFEFLHELLTDIAGGKSVYELVALVQLIELENQKLMESRPPEAVSVVPSSLEEGVRRSEIFVISEPPPPPDGSYDTGVTG